MQAYTLAPSSWSAQLGSERVLLREDYVPHLEHVPERRSSKASAGSLKRGASLGRKQGGMFDQRGAADGDSMRRGARLGASVQSERAEHRIMHALTDDPTLQRIGQRELVTGEIERPKPDSPPMLRVRCDCGAEAYVQAGSWINRASNVGRACGPCARKPRGGSRA
jgi:hypothetical protein